MAIFIDSKGLLPMAVSSDKGVFPLCRAMPPVRGDPGWRLRLNGACWLDGHVVAITGKVDRQFRRAATKREARDLMRSLVDDSAVGRDRT